MNKDKIIELLNANLMDEHGAIIQYLNHAYGMGEGEMACEIEAIARDEMRHLDWLAETITALGGVPSLDRGTMRMGGASVSDWMSNDVLLEEGAIAHYREHIQAIDDPKIRRLLQRILWDEESHHISFQHFGEEARTKGTRDIRRDRSDEVVSMLNESVEHEYTVVLQYLLHSYMAPGPKAKAMLEDRAINEMQHLGWLSEKIVNLGGNPRIEHGEVDRSTRFADMLRADIELEQEVAQGYGDAAEGMADPEVKRLLRRMQNHENYHAEVFSDLLTEEEPKE